MSHLTVDLPDDTTITIGKAWFQSQLNLIDATARVHMTEALDLVERGDVVGALRKMSATMTYTTCEYRRLALDLFPK